MVNASNAAVTWMSCLHMTRKHFIDELSVGLLLGTLGSPLHFLEARVDDSIPHQEKAHAFLKDHLQPQSRRRTWLHWFQTEFPRGWNSISPTSAGYRKRKKSLIGRVGRSFSNLIPSVPWINFIYELLPHRAVLTERVKQEAPHCQQKFYFSITGYHMCLGMFLCDRYVDAKLNA